MPALKLLVERLEIGLLELLPLFHEAGERLDGGLNGLNLRGGGSRIDVLD